MLSDLREAGFPTVDMKDTFGVRWYTMCIVEPNTDVLYLMNPSAGDSFKDVGWYQNYSKKTSANEHSYNVYFFEAHAAVVMYEASPLHSGESLATRLKKLNGWTVAHVFPPNA